jgi:hypothetical protein
MTTVDGVDVTHLTGDSFSAASGRNAETRVAQHLIRTLVDYLGSTASLGPPPHRLDALVATIAARARAQNAAREFTALLDLHNAEADR